MRSAACSTPSRSPPPESAPATTSPWCSRVPEHAGRRSSRLGHPAKAFYESVRDVVKGASCGCSDVFGARASVEACGVPLLTDNALAGTSGLAGVRNLVERGYTPVVF